jgi:cytochrome b involved in lipid metabolism
MSGQVTGKDSETKKTCWGDRYQTGKVTPAFGLIDIRVFERDELAKSLQAYKDGIIGEKKYMTIDNKVYDITDFIPDHPGGEQVISTHIGKDATGKV